MSIREKLEAAWACTHGERPCLVGLELHDWLTAHRPFERLLDAEAWLDAAMMLVPEGWDWARWSKGTMVLTRPHDDEKFFAHTIEEAGDTPAEALLAAIEKARM